MPDEETVPTPSPTEEPATPPAADATSSGEPKQEASPAPTEPEAVQSEPQAQTAQIPVIEPLPPEPEPIPPASEPLGQATKSADSPAPTQSAQPVATSNASPTDSQQVASDRLVIARASIQDRKRKKLDKIMEALGKKENITNDEVEKLLHVSDATATRYLSALEKEGKVKQVGKTGIGVVYTKI